MNTYLIISTNNIHPIAISIASFIWWNSWTYDLLRWNKTCSMLHKYRSIHSNFFFPKVQINKLKTLHDNNYTDSKNLTKPTYKTKQLTATHDNGNEMNVDRLTKPPKRVDRTKMRNETNQSTRAKSKTRDRGRDLLKPFSTR